MPSIKLRSSDGQTFEVDVEIAKCSTTLKTMLEDLAVDEEIIPLPNITSEILSKVITWATHHHQDGAGPQPDNISPWDVGFLKVDQRILVDLILAANYLDIKGLLDVACKSVANMMEGKTADEIRATFNIENDFTPEEEEELRQEAEGLRTQNEHYDELDEEGEK